MSKGKIMVADDDQNICELLRLYLEKEGYGVTLAHDGEAAVEQFFAEAPDLVLLDIMMPKLDGLEVLRRLRRRGDQIPVLLLTAKGEVEDKVLGLDCGANDYLSKPFAAQELLARIRAMTRTQTMRENTALRQGNLVLDRTAFTLSTPYGSERLPNKEYQILEMLMRRPGVLISAERFIEVVWGLDSDIDVSAVRVHISCLRKILSQLQSNMQITARRNAGYCLGER